MSVEPLLVFGLNPAWQRLFILDRITLGGVHRLPIPQEFASGKGINFSRVYQKLGGTTHGIQFLAGKNGSLIQHELAKAKLATSDILLSGETRICTTYSTEEGNSTEFIEVSPSVNLSEMRQFLAVLEGKWNAHSSVVLCGTAPAGFDWSKLCSYSLEGKRVFLDAWTGVGPWLVQGVELLKVNAQELAALLGLAGNEEVLDVFALGKAALAQFKIRHLVVTQGARRVVVFHSQGFLTLCPPRATPFVNAIGAGDAFMAGWVYAVLQGKSMRDALVQAVAVSVARCQVALPWELDLQQVKVLEKECETRVEESLWNS